MIIPSIRYWHTAETTVKGYAIPAVLTPPTGSFDPVPLCILYRGGFNGGAQGASAPLPKHIFISILSSLELSFTPMMLTILTGL